MQQAIASTANNKYIKIGLIAVTISAIIYALGVNFISFEDDRFFPIFLINYGISSIYFFVLLGTGRLKKENNGNIHFLISLIAFLISAYSLNRTIPIFEQSAQWFSVLLVVVSLSVLAIGVWERLPILIQKLSLFIHGVGLVAFFYLFLYLGPVYPISLIGLIALGISIHSFIPLLLVIFLTKWHFTKSDKYQKPAIFALSGIAFAILCIAIFSYQWHKIDRFVNSKYQHSLLADNAEMPSWIKVAEELPENWLTEKYLKGKLVFTVAEQTNWDSWSLPTRNFDEARKHDPLVLIASFFSPNATINEADRIKILEAQYDSRHKTQERLWRGDDLKTSNVISNIKIWPSYRIAYTEQTITVVNTDLSNSWRNQQEAIYTFHLPEGAVVSSLSLWINGQEEKGILTTKSKADSAYKTIVGVENRDPSVVHWQEGNTVSVRVFPVLQKQNRIFKIGISAPLTLVDGKLKYESIYFDGPSSKEASAITQIDWDKKPAELSMKGFTNNGGNRYIKEGNYQKSWSLVLQSDSLSTNNFCFNNQCYSVANYKASFEQKNFINIYLDINKAWSKNDFDQIMAMAASKNIYVYQDALIKITKENSNSLFEQLNKKNFSLFPIQHIDNPSNALLITKGTESSPNLKDLKGSEFAENLEKWVQQKDKICVYNFNQFLNPYLKSLKEHRVFIYGQGDLNSLAEMLKNNQYFARLEDEHNVIVDNAQIILTKNKSERTNANAPDHLLRLFSYNQILYKLNTKIFTNQETNTSLIALAQEANIVSPLSSLVVLETKADYERFNIKSSKNSLQNASLKSKGAVPEPHEWALIITAILLLLWHKYKHKLTRLFVKL